jgi:hypothetical protein
VGPAQIEKRSNAQESQGVKIDLVKRILRKGYSVSVDDGQALLVHRAIEAREIMEAMKTKSDLLWIYKKEDKLGWMKINSRTGEVLNYSTRDTRVCDLVAEAFVTIRRKR